MKAFFAICCFLTTAVLFPALSAGEWFTDFEKAKAESLKTNRPIYMLFSNPDSAISLSYDRNIFKQRKFQDYADKNLVLMRVDFPVAIHKQQKSLREQNSRLKSKFGIAIMPAAILVDANGMLVTDFIEIDGGMEKHRRKLNDIMDFDPPKRYTEYLDKYVRAYTPPKPQPKQPEVKPAKNPSAAAKNPPAAKNPANAAKKNGADQKQADGTVIIPDENGRTLVPLDPEGNFQDWLKAAAEEEATEAEKEIEEAKEAVEEAKEAIEATEKAEAPAEKAEAPAEKAEAPAEAPAEKAEAPAAA